MTIPEIFSQSGEAGFRQIETQVLTELGRKSGLIIATGGGCVTQDRNYPLLHQNGTCVWITRNLQSLPTDGRPLSQAGKLEQMYRIRKPLYERFADMTVSNDKTAEDCAATIMELLSYGGMS